MPRMEQWAVTAEPDPFKAPEARRPCLHGIAYGHHIHADGARVTTTPIHKVERFNGSVLVTTRSGTIYELGTVSPDYEAVYANAVERLGMVADGTN